MTATFPKARTPGSHSTHFVSAFAKAGNTAVPIFTVQQPALPRRSEVSGLNLLATTQVGDGSGHLEDPVVGAGGRSSSVCLTAYLR